MKKLIGGMFVGALLLAGCGEPTPPVKQPDKTKPAAVCPKCGKTPCECKPVAPPAGGGEKETTE